MRRPKTASVDGGHVLEAGAEGGAGLAEFVIEPLREGFGAVEGKDGPAPGFGIEQVGETRLDAGALVNERERGARRAQFGRQADAVFLGLDFDLSER